MRPLKDQFFRLVLSKVDFLKGFFSFFLFLCFSTGWSQELPPVRNFSPSTYRAENQNWMIAQSDDRKMYFANNKGLLEFNGEQWYSYPTPNESIMRSVAWHDGLLYSGSYMDFGYWKPLPDGRLSYTSIVEQLEVPVKEDEQFWNIISTPSGILVQSLHRVYSYHPNDQTIRVILEKDRLTKLFKINNRIFYHASDEGLFEIVNGKSVLTISTASLDGDVVSMGTRAGTIVFITSTNALYTLTGNNASLIIRNKFEKDVTVYAATQLQDGNFALGTISNGLIVIDANGRIQYQMDQKNGLSNNTVLSTFKDLDNNLWLGLDNGIDFINIQSRFKTFIDRTGKLGTIYTSLVDKQENLYVGTNQGLYVRFAGSTEFQFVENTKGQVWTLELINDKLLCGHNLGTFLISGDQALPISTIEGSWDFQQPALDTTLLVQGNYNGLNVLERSNNSWKFRNKIEGFDISSKDFIVAGNKIFVSHEYKGLYELEVTPDYRKVQSVRLLNEVGKGINSDLIQLGNDLLYANKNGFFYKKAGSDVFEREVKLSQLIENGEYTSGKMIKIDDRSFWFFTRGALNKIFIEPLQGQFEIKKMLLPQSKRFENSGYESLIQLNNTDYLLGTANGYLIFNTLDETLADQPVFIDRMILQVGNEPEIALDLDQIHTIPQGTNRLRFFFHTTEYGAFSDVKYQYKLSHIMPDWSAPQTSDRLTFENLDHGTYTLQLRSVINCYVSNSIVTTKFIIEPPFFLSKVAIICYLLLLILVIILINLFYRWYYQRKKNRELNKQQQAMEWNLLQSEKNIAELKNQQLNADIESRNRELAVTTMAMIKKNETLNEIKSELEKLKGATDKLSPVKEIIDKNLVEQQDWKTFEQAFSMTDKSYIKDLKARHPNLTSGDLRLCIYIRLNLSSKEIAPLLNISPRSVEIKRYRLRKKMELEKKTDLFEYLIGI